MDENYAADQGVFNAIHRGAGDFPPDERQVKIRAIVEEFD